MKFHPLFFLLCLVSSSKKFKNKKLKLKQSIAKRKIAEANPFDGKFDEVYQKGIKLLD
jgi:hypothetical protein